MNISRLQWAHVNDTNFTSVLGQSEPEEAALKLPKAFFMGIAVLNDQTEHPLRIFYRQDVGHRRPEIMHIKKEPFHADLAQQRVDCLGHGVEGVGIVVGRFGKAEPRRSGATTCATSDSGPMTLRK